MASALSARRRSNSPPEERRGKSSVRLDPQRLDELALVLIVLARTRGKRGAVQIDDRLIEPLGRRLERLGLGGVFARALEHGDNLARRALRREKAVEARRHRRHVELGK